MLYVTHDQKEALSMAERVAVMSMGSVEQVGPPRTLYRRPASRFVAEFIGEANVVPGILEAVEASMASVQTPLGTFRGRLDGDSIEPGTDVVCMVRPECIALGPGDSNAFRARLVSSMYLGETEQFLLEAGELELRAMRANPGDETEATGHELDVHVDPDDVVILPAAEGGAGS
jgi:iron(III) transport system ATP-binding protein